MDFGLPRTYLLATRIEDVLFEPAVFNSDFIFAYFDLTSLKELDVNLTLAPFFKAATEFTNLGSFRNGMMDPCCASVSVCYTTGLHIGPTQDDAYEYAKPFVQPGKIQLQNAAVIANFFLQPNYGVINLIVGFFRLSGHLDRQLHGLREKCLHFDKATNWTVDALREPMATSWNFTNVKHTQTSWYEFLDEHDELELHEWSFFDVVIDRVLHWMTCLVDYGAFISIWLCGLILSAFCFEQGYEVHSEREIPQLVCPIRFRKRRVNRTPRPRPDSGSRRSIGILCLLLSQHLIPTVAIWIDPKNQNSFSIADFENEATSLLNMWDSSFGHLSILFRDLKKSWRLRL